MTCPPPQWAVTAPAPTDATPAPERDPWWWSLRPNPTRTQTGSAESAPEQQKVQAESAAESSPANDSGSASDFSDFDIPDLGGSMTVTPLVGAPAATTTTSISSVGAKEEKGDPHYFSVCFQAHYM